MALEFYLHLQCFTECVCGRDSQNRVVCLQVCSWREAASLQVVKPGLPLLDLHSKKNRACKAGICFSPIKLPNTFKSFNIKKNEKKPQKIFLWSKSQFSRPFTYSALCESLASLVGWSSPGRLEPGAQTGNLPRVSEAGSGAPRWSLQPSVFWFILGPTYCFMVKPCGMDENTRPAWHSA